MRKQLCGVVLLLAGCTPWTQVQLDLAEQARRGVAMTAAAIDEKSTVIASLRAEQRRAIDDAFDADVRQREPLTADWVIEHRRAYTSALESLHEVQTRSLLADESTRRTIRATDDALRQLQLLQSMQLRLTTTFSETRQ